MAIVPTVPRGVVPEGFHVEYAVFNAKDVIQWRGRREEIGRALVRSRFGTENAWHMKWCLVSNGWVQIDGN